MQCDTSKRKSCKFALRNRKLVRWCNGSTSDSGSACEGSSPSRATAENRQLACQPAGDFYFSEPRKKGGHKPPGERYARLWNKPFFDSLATPFLSFPPLIFCHFTVFCLWGHMPPFPPQSGNPVVLRGLFCGIPVMRGMTEPSPFKRKGRRK